MLGTIRHASRLARNISITVRRDFALCRIESEMLWQVVRIYDYQSIRTESRGTSGWSPMVPVRGAAVGGIPSGSLGTRRSLRGGLCDALI